MQGFSITTERIAATGGAATDIGGRLAGEIGTMHGLLADLRAGWQSSEAAPRFAAAMEGHLAAAATLKDALLTHGSSLTSTAQQFDAAESALAGAMPAVA
ncbi:WXG100 family type VII secretion target [Nakamurella leprariae]|uniref:WXG100 family type VII secretion target n=1 Tax=Nakamurella leprariae TaxID=2803911 RepID=A0A938YDZ5_9ACTN|nr:WXG100 family type VII secretion target [Nakamurella leprariae]MBM9466687.1 WXG100 family type VII secretion target [Nakamurella leprariae]